MDKVSEILRSIREDIDYEKTNDLISGKVLKSFEILMLISNLEEELDIEIDPTEMTPEHFDSLDKIRLLVESKRA